MKQRFKITYEVVTSASGGDAQWRGFLPCTGVIPRRNHMPKRPALFTLRQAFDLFEQHASPWPIEADSSHLSASKPPRWITSDSHERPGDFRNGEGDCTSLSLHLGDISPSSAMRVARLFKTHGIKS